MASKDVASPPYVYYESMEKGHAYMHFHIPLPRSLGLGGFVCELQWTEELKELVMHAYDILCPVILDRILERDEERKITWEAKQDG